MDGYAGKVLRANFTKREAIKESINKSVWKSLIGGVGYGAYVLYNEVSKEVSPLGPDNKIIFSTGPFQATNLPGSAKFVAITKSPMNSFFSTSAAGADFGLALKKAGYDALIIEGKANKPVYLEIENEKISFNDANELWGKDTYETTDIIKEDYGKKDFSVAVIGQAGENLIKFAAINVDKHSFFGRTGMGAVLGSKNIKAICVKGDKDIKVADKNKVKELRKELTRKIAEATSDFGKHGTSVYMGFAESVGEAPIKNWSGGTWSKGNKKLGAPTYTETIFKKRLPCPNCPIGCHRYVKVDFPEKYKMEGPGPEYETLAYLGENLLIDDLSAVAKAGELCNRYGMDTMEVGGIIGFLMECYEKGFIDKEDINGLDLTWGNADATIELIKMIAFRNNFGDVLANGILPTVEKIDPKTRDFAVEVKGICIGAHDPRARFGQALNFATGPVGPHHENANLSLPYWGVLLPELGIDKIPQPFEMEGTEYLVAKYQDWAALYNSLVVCRFMMEGEAMRFGDMVDCLNAITGWNIPLNEVAKTTERIFTLERMVNTKFGLTKKNDVLPKRILEATSEGPHVGKAPKLEPTLRKYYELRGWDENGVPRKEKIVELGLDKI